MGEAAAAAAAAAATEVAVMPVAAVPVSVTATESARVADVVEVTVGANLPAPSSKKSAIALSTPG
jgi:hypothetical protein